MSQLDGISEKDTTEDDYPVPVGQTRVKFKISDGIERTVMPSTSLVGKYFVIEFTDTGDSSVVRWPTSGRVVYSSTITALVPESTYSVVVTAYNAETGGQTISGWTSPSSITINTANAPNTINVLLVGKLDGVGSGFFTYSINVPPITQPDNTTIAYIPNGDGTGGTDEDSMVLEVFQSGASKYKQVLGVNTITSSPAGGVQLLSGYYTIKVTLKANNCQDRVMNTVMHIYNGLTSDYSPTVYAPVQDKFTVAFDTTTNASDASSVSSITNVVNASTLGTAPSTPPTSSTYDFNGWFDAASGGSAFPFATKRIFKDTTVFAHWVPKSGISTGIVISFTVIPDLGSGKLVANTSSPVSYDELADGTSSLEFTLTDVTGATWFLDGDDITPLVVSNQLIIGGLGASNLSLLPKLASGYHLLDVFGTGTDTNPYSAHVEFELDND